jgi:hypothetical protein
LQGQPGLSFGLPGRVDRRFAPQSKLEAARQRRNFSYGNRGLLGGGLIVRSASFGVCAVSGIFLSVTGCAVVDQYSGRAVVYNLEAEQAQEKALLLNIVRASLRKPMQFTGLQSISGTASASGGLSTSNTATGQRPLISLFGLTPPNSSTVVSSIVANNLGGNVSFSGGPTFAVPVLDTQEFYQGFLNPVSGQLVDLYFHNGYPRDALFNLIVSKIVIKRVDGECRPEIHTAACEATIRNYPPEDVSLHLFQATLGYLIRLGLSTEQVEVRKSAKSADGKSQESTTEKQYSFCFAPREAESYRLLNPLVLCGNPAASTSRSQIAHLSNIPGVTLTREFIETLYAAEVAPRVSGEEVDVRAKGYASLRLFAGRKISVTVYTRSVEGVLYYLGEVVRRVYHPEGGQSDTPVQVRVGPPQNPFPTQACPFEEVDGYRCSPLFVLDEVPDPNGVSVLYDGRIYSIHSDSSKSWTLPVFDVVKQLQALNTSAKQLPASNLISILAN